MPSIPAAAPLQIRSFLPSDEAAVIALWRDCGLLRPWNDPHRDIARKSAVQPELFLVGLWQQTLCASAMVGYDGHRGWLNYLAVAPAQQRRGIARALVERAEDLLLARGCPKLNLQVRRGNDQAQAFYRKLGYLPDEAVSLGKRLIVDPPPGNTAPGD